MAQDLRTFVAAMHQPIRNGRGERLDHRFRAARSVGAQDERRDLAVIGVRSGAAGSDARLAAALAEALAAAGVASLCFTYAGCGESEGDAAAATVSKAVDDLGAVLEHCAGWRVVCIGHGLGAAAGQLRASSDPRITALISLAGVVDCAGFARRAAGAAEPAVRPSAPVLDDLLSLDRLDQLAARIRVPWLLVQAGADDVVPLADARAVLAHAEHGNARLALVPGADHGFATGGAGAAVCDLVCDFLATAWAD